MPDVTFQPRRSLIFCSGLRPEMFPKAVRTGADMVCIDLEDAVAPQHKGEARERALAFFAQPQADDGVERILRINSLRSAEGLRDVIAVAESAAPPLALMLTKVRSADEVRQLDDVLSEGGLPTRFHVIIETNDGLDAAYEIARASGRIDTLLFGGVDMAAELRTRPSWETLHYARSRVVHAAAGADLDLIDVPWLDLDDMDGMADEARACVDLGFTGKAAIHPKQISALNEVFSPAPSAVDRARRIVQAFEESDDGLVVMDGKLIEKPVLRSMRRLIAVADAIAARGG